MDCRRVSSDPSKVDATMCPNDTTGKHYIVKKAIMCQQCEALGDDFTEFMNTPCRGKPCERGSGALRMPQSFQAKVEAPKSLPADIPQAESMDGPQEKLSMEMKTAQIEMTKLLFLQSLRDERQELQRLLALKPGKSILTFLYFL